MEIIAIHLKEADKGVCDYLSSYLSNERQEMIERFRFTEDRLRSFFSELLIKTYAIEKWEIAVQDIIFNKNKFGKPSIDRFPKCHFNISHSGEWVVAAFDNTPVGIDIEKVSPIDISISNSIFSSLEKDHLDSQPDESKLSYFYQLWTLKESYIKAIGKGLSIPLQSFSFNLTNEGIKFQSVTDNEPWCFKQYTLEPGYKLAICGLDPLSFPEKILKHSWKDLTSRFQSLIDKN